MTYYLPLPISVLDCPSSIPVPSLPHTHCYHTEPLYCHHTQSVQCI